MAETNDERAWYVARMEVNGQHSCTQQQWDWSNARELAMEVHPHIPAAAHLHLIEERLKNARAISDGPLEQQIERDIRDIVERVNPVRRRRCLAAAWRAAELPEGWAYLYNTQVEGAKVYSRTPLERATASVAIVGIRAKKVLYDMIR